MSDKMIIETNVGDIKSSYEDTYPLTIEEYECLFEVPDDVEVE